MRIELDEMWSFVKNKSNQCWLWLALNHDTRTILAYTFGKRKDEVFEVFEVFKKILKPFAISKFYSDNWGSYSRTLDTVIHEIGKKNT